MEIYKPDEYEEIKLPKPGEQQKGVITSINEGCLSDFIDEKALELWKSAEGTDPCIEIVAEMKDGFTRRKVITVPKDKKIHPKSNFGKWKKQYGKYPFVGQEVFFLANAEGFYNFQL